METRPFADREGWWVTASLRGAAPGSCSCFLPVPTGSERFKTPQRLHVASAGAPAPQPLQSQALIFTQKLACTLVGFAPSLSRVLGSVQPSGTLHVCLSCRCAQGG